MINVSREDFEELVARAWAELPPEFVERVDNLAVVVEEWPDPATLEMAKVQHPAELLGFYRGVPQTRRTHHYGLIAPDKISIYRQPILQRCRTLKEVWETVSHVLRHELAHYFGIGDERLREIGAY